MSLEHIIHAKDESCDEEEHQHLFRCTEMPCSYSTKRRYDLKRHVLRKHHSNPSLPEQPRLEYLCDQCGKQYRSRYGLDLHIKDTHTYEYRFTCSTCNAGFNRLWDFTGHINGHNKIKGEKCETCGKTFQYKKSLVAHKKTHITSKVSAFLCNVCGLNLSCKDSLAEHIKGLHEGRIFVCPCGKTFPWRSSFKYHESVCKAMK